MRVQTLVFSIVTSKRNLAYGLYSIGLTQLAETLGPLKEEDDDITRGVESDVNSISGWVLDCTGVRRIEDFPEQVQRDFGIRFPFSPQSAKITRLPNHLERAILTLSQSVSAQRRALRARADSAFRFLEATSIITIILGMFTTILVALSSTEFGRGDGRIQRLIRILAIIFPALGTAAAALIAFYSPQAEWSQASRTLASLTQLHGQMAIGVWKLHCISPDDEQYDAKVASALDEWSRRYVDIQTVSTAAAASGAGAGGGQPPSGGGGGQAPSGGGGGQTRPAPANP
jgi:hypothetical protein